MSGWRQRIRNMFRRRLGQSATGSLPQSLDRGDQAIDIDPETRIGLALSGGGFRAAFFHLGVLARLAERGILPRVEVISTVSGGSIIGTAYYLMVRNLLEEKGVDQLSRSDYVDLVEDLERRMRKAVRCGMRGRMLANPLKNLAMISPWLPKGRVYSRTDRIGDMADRYLYKRIFWQGDPDCVPKRDKRIPLRLLRRDRQVELREILIRPEGKDLGGKPKGHNRAAGLEFKVPELAINATCLNTGHRWCFEASHMGEEVGLNEDHASEEDPTSEEETSTDVIADGNVTLKPGYFLVPGKEPVKGRKALPEKLQDFPLGLAVAASAAFPGAFPALPVSGMYSNLRVQLTDGGVSDNQGVQALTDHKCNVMIVSDGSGQMKDLARLGGGAIASLGRSSSIQGDRVRELQLKAAESGGKPGEKVDVHTIHLREGLNPRPLPPDGTYSEPVWPPSGKAIEGRPVHPRALEAVSRIRTDLDTFSRVEIDSIAACGYLLAGLEFGDNKELADLKAPVASQKDWCFIQRVGESLAVGDPDLIKKINRGSKRFFRFLFPIVGFIRFLVSLALVAGAILGVVWIVQNWMEFCEGVGDVVSAWWIPFVAAVAGVVLAWTLGLTIVLWLYRRVRQVLGGPG